MTFHQQLKVSLQMLKFTKKTQEMEWFKSYKKRRGGRSISLDNSHPRKHSMRFLTGNEPPIALSVPTIAIVGAVNFIKCSMCVQHCVINTLSFQSLLFCHGVATIMTPISQTGSRLTAAAFSDLPTNPSPNRSSVDNLGRGQGKARVLVPVLFPTCQVTWNK